MKIKREFVALKEEPKMKPHVHAEWIKLAADGVDVERLYFTDINEAWLKATLQDICEAPGHAKFRLKPQPTPDVVFTYNAALSIAEPRVMFLSVTEGNLRLTFDGETGQLKDAEVIR